MELKSRRLRAILEEPVEAILKKTTLRSCSGFDGCFRYRLVSPKLPAAHQLSIVVLNFADATVKVTQRGLPPSSVLLLAAGLERAPESLEIPASLRISA